MQTSLYIYLALYVLALIFCSWWVARKESSEGFLIADRDRSWWGVASSKFAASVGVGYFVAYTGYAYQYGFGVYTVLLGSIIGYAVFAFWATPRLYVASKQELFYTQGDFVYYMTGCHKARRITNAFANLILFGWLLIGIIGGAKIISYFGLMSYEMALIATIIVILSYILMAGFKAVLFTDLIQAVVIFGLMGFLTWIVVSQSSLELICSAQTEQIDAPTSFGFLIYGLLALFSYSNFYQLVYAAKDQRTAMFGIGVAIIPAIIVATFLLLIGLFMMTQSSDFEPDFVFLESMSRFVPEAILPFGIVLFFAGLMSSADTYIYAIASHFVLNGGYVESPVERIRMVTLVLGVLCFVIGYFFRSLVDITILMAAMSVSLSPAMIYLIAGGKNRYRFLGSVSCAFLSYCIALPFLGIDPTMILPVLLGGLLGLGYNGFLLNENSS